MPNRIKEIWAQGGTAIGGWLAIPSGFSAEVMAKAGYDALNVDMQHGVQDYQSLVACYQAIGPAGPVPMARVPWLEPGIIGKVLDAGAAGIICPMVNTVQQAKDLVSYMRYPPVGVRSHGPIRAGTYGEAGTYYKTANADVICMPMIETEEAVDNIDAIVDVPGIDAVYVGPGDLGFSIGLQPKLDREEPEIMVIIDIKMPVMNGYEAIKKIRGLRPGLPIIAQTAFALSNEMLKAFNAGSNDYISKPFKKDQLLALVSKHLMTGKQ